jgi:hypothetical protein
MKTALLSVILVLAFTGSYAQNEDPYAIFGHKSAVNYESNIHDFLYIKNTDTCSEFKAIALDARSGKIFLLGTDNCVIQSLDVEPTDILTWVSVDPKADKYPSLSPYNYVANNPLNAIDPDGRDIIVLNNPQGGSGYGHMAIMIGNDKSGWSFISKEGRIKGIPNLNEGTGGPALPPLLIQFKKLADFQKAQENNKNLGGYTQSVRFGTNAEQDANAKKTSIASASSWYHFMFNNCADAVSDGLKAAGLDPGYQFIPPSIDDGIYSIGGPIILTNPVPNQRFLDIIRNNKPLIIPTIPPVKDEKKTTSTEY